MRGPRARRDARRRGVLALSRRPRLLALRALGLGDFLTGVPALRALRRAHADSEILVAAPRALEPLVALAGVADRLLPTGGLQPVPWTGDPPDLAVNLHGRGPQSTRLLTGLHPGRVVAFGCEAAPHRGPEWVEEEHERDRWCRLVQESLQVAADPTDLLLTAPATPAPCPGAVVVHPGAAYPSRRWPPDRFAAVTRALRATGRDVVVTGGPGEVSLASGVAAAAGLAPTAVLAGRTDLDQLAAQVAGSALLVCGDTGLAHLATAFGTPSVLLFGPVSPQRWGPPGHGPHTVLWHGDGAGDPWGDATDPALLRIGVPEVVEAAEHALTWPAR
ncbi:MAG TPA: glycosyltransferase family 9 protein [Nocardioidaceae bacterium]|nr:glycosyltransferase family 9 protein [Nocardioidaceae bacterium]